VEESAAPAEGLQVGDRVYVTSLKQSG